MKKVFIASLLGFMPAVVFGQAVSSTSGLFGKIFEIIDAAIPVIFALAVLFFIWNLGTFFFGPSDKKDEAKGGIVWGIVILFVMASIFGILNLVQDTAGIDVNDNLNVPKIKSNINQ